MYSLKLSKTVSESADTAKSVTRQCIIHSGEALLLGPRNKRCKRKVNVIDTLGLCDSEIDMNDCVRLVQHYLECRLMYLRGKMNT